jgi:hypothetical protein
MSHPIDAFAQRAREASPERKRSDHVERRLVLRDEPWQLAELRHQASRSSMRVFKGADTVMLHAALDVPSAVDLRDDVALKSALEARDDAKLSERVLRACAARKMPFSQ